MRLLTESRTALIKGENLKTIGKAIGEIAEHRLITLRPVNHHQRRSSPLEFVGKLDSIHSRTQHNRILRSRRSKARAAAKSIGSIPGHNASTILALSARIDASY